MIVVISIGRVNNTVVIKKKVPVFFPYHGRATVHRFNLNGVKMTPRDPYYARSMRVLRPFSFCH